MSYYSHICFVFTMHSLAQFNCLSSRFQKYKEGLEVSRTRSHHPHGSMAKAVASERNEQSV